MAAGWRVVKGATGYRRSHQQRTQRLQRLRRRPQLDIYPVTKPCRVATRVGCRVQPSYSGHCIHARKNGSDGYLAW
jgi:hypothetical protein